MTPIQTARMKLALEAMSELGYDAINVSYLDLAGGIKVLKNLPADQLIARARELLPVILEILTTEPR